ncbi:MAG: SagB/ThcOx family dehydrogenase [Candidatus Bathyarchaeota archaeon]|nr:SagB/ThcOx family dehydrogenase [Candidatus Bathyarchaeota archaeon]
MSSGIGLEFMQKTQFKQMRETDQGKGLASPPLELDFDGTKSIISLPHWRDINMGSIDLAEAIVKRRSVRKYSEEPLTLKELSFLLWCTQGVKKVLGLPATLRTVPSAGARHALETYLLVNRIQGMQPGLYRFLAVSHKLVEINLDPNLADRITEACLDQRFVKTSGVTFIWVAVPYRMVWRYGERGYRYLLIDVGHVCQNLYLAAEAIGAGACAIGAFDDEAINESIGADGKQQFVIYVATVGRKQTA